jgi:hypothetical protein
VQGQHRVDLMLMLIDHRYLKHLLMMLVEMRHFVHSRNHVVVLLIVVVVVAEVIELVANWD